MNPLVTIAIPVYNAEEFLYEAIQSVIRQTFSDWELILINDGSNDRSLEIMQEFDSDVRVTILNDGQNKGLIHRLNQSVKLGRGFYYARMDADDIMDPNRIEKQIAYLNNNPKVDVLGSAAYSIDRNNEIIGIKPSANNRWDRHALIKGSAFIHPSVMGKREWFLNNPYDSEWERAEDYQLWLRTIEHSSFHNLEEPLLFYRELGIPTFSKYFKTQKTIMKIWSNRKILEISTKDAVNVYLSAVVKSFIYAIFFIIGMTDKIVASRIKSLDKIELQIVQKKFNYEITYKD